MTTWRHFARLDEVTVGRADRGELGWFCGGGDAAACAIVAKDPVARWVSSNLSERMVLEPVQGGERMPARTEGVLRFARFELGLCADGTAETPDL